jgi:hypothetical protein
MNFSFPWQQNAQTKRSYKVTGACSEVKTANLSAQTKVNVNFQKISFLRQASRLSEPDGGVIGTICGHLARFQFH